MSLKSAISLNVAKHLENQKHDVKKTETVT